ncbi:capreomycidine synthase, partial [Kitasatospora sp. NPDC047058]
AQATANRAVLAGWLAEHREQVSADLPAGGVTAFPELTTVTDVTAFADRLDRDHGVLVVPGACFGAPRHIRLGFGGSSTELAAGLDRLAALLPAAG